MNTKEYAREFIDKLTELYDVCKKLRWDFATYDNNHVEATAQISTVSGKRNVTVVFINGTVFPVVILAQGVPDGDLSDEVWVEVLEKMNNVNSAYSNVVVAFGKKGEYSSWDFYLRGLQSQMYQDDYSNMSELEWTVVLALNVDLVGRFIEAMNNGYGQDVLQDLMNMFE